MWQSVTVGPSKAESGASNWTCLKTTIVNHRIAGDPGGEETEEAGSEKTEGPDPSPLTVVKLTGPKKQTAHRVTNY